MADPADLRGFPRRKRTSSRQKELDCSAVADLLPQDKDMIRYTPSYSIRRLDSLSPSLSLSLLSVGAVKCWCLIVPSSQLPQKQNIKLPQTSEQGNTKNMATRNSRPLFASCLFNLPGFFALEHTLCDQRHLVA